MEASPFRPSGPQGIAMVGAWGIVTRRWDIDRLHASTAILLDHESELQSRGTLGCQATRAAKRIRRGLKPAVSLARLDLKREWSHAVDLTAVLPRMAPQDSVDH